MNKNEVIVIIRESNESTGLENITLLDIDGYNVFEWGANVGLKADQAIKEMMELYMMEQGIDEEDIMLGDLTLEYGADYVYLIEYNYYISYEIVLLNRKEG